MLFSPAQVETQTLVVPESRTSCHNDDRWQQHTVWESIEFYLGGTLAGYC